MPRKARITVTGALHHIMARGNEGKPIFVDDEDRRFFQIVLEQQLAKSGNQLYAWCQMENHYHLLVRCNDYPLGAFMRVLNGRYAQYFQKKRKASGYLFQDRFKSIVTQDQHYVEELVRYIHLNPVRAGICRFGRELDNYRWSGHAVVVGKRVWNAQNTADVLQRFSRQKTDAILKYRNFLKAGLGKEPDVYSSIRKTGSGKVSIHDTGSWVIGNREFVAQALSAEETRRVRIARHAREGLDIAEIAGRLVDEMGITISELMCRGRKDARAKARRVVAYTLNRKYGVPVIRIAEYFGISSPAVSVMVREGEMVAG